MKKLWEVRTRTTHSPEGPDGFGFRRFDTEDAARKWAAQAVGTPAHFKQSRPGVWDIPTGFYTEAEFVGEACPTHGDTA